MKQLFVLLLVAICLGCTGKKYISQIPFKYNYSLELLKKESEMEEKGLKNKTIVNDNSENLSDEVLYLKEKYSIVLAVMPNKITNYKLYSYFDSWINTPYKEKSFSKNGIDCSYFLQSLYSDVYKVTLPKVYADVKNIHQKEVFYYYLKQMRCFYDNLEIQVEEGYNVPFEHLDIENIINRNYTNLSGIMQEVNEFYSDHFYTLKGELKYKPIKDYGREYSCFEEVTKENGKHIIWVKLVFPESLVPQIIDNISFVVNCFPVINKRKHTIRKSLDGFLSYVALETGNNIYLDLDSVIDSSEDHYEIKEFNEGILEEGCAVLRTGGVSRFDSRSASELLQNVLDLLKDESSSFAGIGKDFINSSLVEINQLLASVQQQAKEKDFSKTNDPYLMIKPKNDGSEGKNFAINYWSTCAEEGNDIKAGTMLECKDTFFISKDVTLMTNTVGGVNKQTNKDRILAYRNALLTRGRIVTFADIKAFGFNHFKGSIDDIRIEKGTRKEISVKAGFSRTVDIYIKTNPEEKQHLSNSEWEYLCDSFLKNLKSKSSNVYPYRMFID
ncbi:hypothetical protein [Flavobacterium panacagri]|uniref:hypothetical protein n=1 Tax=Flavobacterium panacagri TaxID=3034146 RepID=UPI0025A5F148|nr:hypothetical protein [Flavobacterium panacagri]